MKTNRLQRQSPDEDANQNQAHEELYEELFPKIGRDFIHRDDFERIMIHLLSILDPSGLIGIDFNDTSGAIAKAREYQSVLDSGQDGTELYRDLIDLDD